MTDENEVATLTPTAIETVITANVQNSRRKCGTESEWAKRADTHCDSASMFAIQLSIRGHECGVSPSEFSKIGWGSYLFNIPSAVSWISLICRKFIGEERIGNVKQES